MKAKKSELSQATGAKTNVRILEDLRASTNGRIGVKLVTPEQDYNEDVSIRTVVQPTDILVSKWFPGYRPLDLTGASADEAIGLMLANAITTTAAVNEFQNLLSNSSLPAIILGKLLPRAGQPVKQRKYLMTEGMISEVVNEVLNEKGFTSFASRTAYCHAITRILSYQDIVMPGLERKLALQAETFAISGRDVSRIVLTEAFKDLFSESRLQSISRELNNEATPQVIGTQIGKLFRQLSFSIPEIKLRLEHLDIVANLILRYHTDRESIPFALQAHPALGALASIANFIVFSAGRPQLAAPIENDIQTCKEACNSILTIIQSAPSINSIPLAKFAEFYGETPASSPEGVRRGLVLYKHPGQTSKLEIVDAIPHEDSVEMAAVPAEYAKVTAVAAALSNSLLSCDAKVGLANVIADEIALAGENVDEQGRIAPVLATIDIAEDELHYLALYKAEGVSLVASKHHGLIDLMYSCQIKPQWEMTVLAATPSYAYFSDPAALLLYSSDMRAREPVAMPNRSQSFGAMPFRDTIFVGKANDSLLRGVEKAFMLKMPINSYTGDAHVLELKLLVLSQLLGQDENAYSDRGGAFYAAVKEPGVDREVELLLTTACAYAKDDSKIISDKAKSWLVEYLTPGMLHPSIMAMAQRAINLAIINEKLDGRSLRPQFKEVMTRAFLGTYLAVLHRFGKVDGQIVADITAVVPVSGLTIKSQLALATVPALPNASDVGE